MCRIFIQTCVCVQLLFYRCLFSCSLILCVSFYIHACITGEGGITESDNDNARKKEEEIYHNNPKEDEEKKSRGRKKSSGDDVDQILFDVIEEQQQKKQPMLQDYPSSQAISYPNGIIPGSPPTNALDECFSSTQVRPKIKKRPGMTAAGQQLAGTLTDSTFASSPSGHLPLPKISRGRSGGGAGSRMKKRRAAEWKLLSQSSSSRLTSPVFSEDTEDEESESDNDD